MSNEAQSSPSSSGVRRPALVIMVGAPGTGKSYLARTLSGALGAEIIQTDAVRKELYPEPAYTPADVGPGIATRMNADSTHGQMFSPASGLPPGMKRPQTKTVSR